MGLKERYWSSLVVLLVMIFVAMAMAVAVAEASEGKGYELPENCGKLECAEYEVIQSQNEYEIRSYRNAMWISTSPINSSSYKDATAKGFDILFSYIQGNNDQAAKITMTAPVLVNIIPSTGPFCNSSFVVHFYIPTKYQKDPPQSAQAHPILLPKHKFAAVRRFSGFMDDTNIPNEALALKQSLNGSVWGSAISLNKTSEDTVAYSVAGYNSPFELQNRVNEVLLWFDKL